MKYYKITKFRKTGNNTTILTGLTLEQAKEYCSKEETSGKNWFCGFSEE